MSSRVILGPAILIVILLAYKTIYLCDLYPDENLALELVAVDGVVVGVVFLLSLTLQLIQNKLITRFAQLLALVIIVIYSADVWLIRNVNHRFALFEVISFLPEWRSSIGFLRPWSIVAVFVFISSYFVRCRLPAFGHFLVVVFAVASIALCFFGAGSADGAAKKYLSSVLFEFGQAFTGREENTHRYSFIESAHAFKQFENLELASLGEEKLSVILLIVESLSASDSYKTSALNDRLPGFDTLADEGTLFINFLANEINSEAGIISLLGGYPPLHFPTAEPILFSEFKRQPSVIDSLRRQGYWTEFLASGELSFLNLGAYLEGIGFDSYKGRDEVRAFSEAPSIVMNAPSDDYLYREALGRTVKLLTEKQPFFLTLATSSSHTPYQHPYGGSDTEDAVWSWVDKQIVQFHRELQESGFYSSGVLLVTGDHRKRTPLEKAELKKYGESAAARIPLLVIGKGVSRGRIDTRLFQQADLFPKFSKMFRPKEELSTEVVWVTPYRAGWGRSNKTGEFTVFKKTSNSLKSFPGLALGTQIDWLLTKPENFEEIERKIHIQRAAHQYIRNKGIKDCRFLNTVNVSSSSYSFKVVEGGLYWIRAVSDSEVCLFLDEKFLSLNLPSSEKESISDMARIRLEPGTYRLDLKIREDDAESELELQWLPPGANYGKWEKLPSLQLSN